MELVDLVRPALEAEGLRCEVERDRVPYGHRILAERGGQRAMLDVFNSGKLRPGGSGAVRAELDAFVKRYSEDPGILDRLVVADAESPADASGGPDLYNSRMLVVDPERMDAVVERLAAVSEDWKRTATPFWAQHGADQVVFGGVSSAVKHATDLVVREFDARYEEGVETQYRDRLPALTARWTDHLEQSAQDELRRSLGSELFDFLPAHDRRAMTAALMVLRSDIRLPDYAPAVMPLARAYEGFAVKLAVRLGFVAEVDTRSGTFSLNSVWDNKQTKQFRDAGHANTTMIDGLKQRVKEHRHLRAHSQSSQAFKGDRSEAERYFAQVINDLQTQFAYFRPHLSK